MDNRFEKTRFYILIKREILKLEQAKKHPGVSAFSQDTISEAISLLKLVLDSTANEV